MCHFTISFCRNQIIVNRFDDKVLQSSHKFPDEKLRDIQPNIYHAYYLYLIIPKSNNCRSAILKTWFSASLISSLAMNI